MVRLTMNYKETATSIGLLILRVAIGCFMLKHGWEKLMGYSDLVERFADPIGMGKQLSLISAIGAEVGCSVLVIVGLLTRLAAVPLAFTMLVALLIVHRADPWQVKELAAVYLSVYCALIFTGAGRFSVDYYIWGKRGAAAE
jgi:putative oxidoreductase